jgi:environmental stress-induced protein Ves
MCNDGGSSVTIVVSSTDLVATRWPNGKGVTRDVFGRTMPDGKIDWLISIADLIGDAEFSYFEGIDRVFTLLEGDGIELVLGRAPPLKCRPFVPVLFSGEIPARCCVPAGAGRTFNVFFRKSGPQIRVSAAMLPGRAVVGLGRNLLAVHCAAGSISIGGKSLEVGSTIIEPPDGDIVSNTAAVLLVVNIAATETSTL